MIILKEREIQELYDMKQAITDIEEMLHHKALGKVDSHVRTVIEFPEEKASALYMPSADHLENLVTMKAVTIFPYNPSIGKATTQGVILLSDTTNGEHIGLMDASYLTRLRTGAMSGLATERLALKNAETLTIIGTGGMAFEQTLGILAVRNIKEILLFNPTEKKAHHFKSKLREFGIDHSIKIEILLDVNEAARRAQIICCSTRSETPVFNGEEIQPGTHVNGVGSYLPHMREVDFNFIQRTSKIVVDDLEGIKEEAGELIHAAQQPDWSFENIYGELISLVTDETLHRENDKEITFFKSVGAAYYDMAVAIGVYKKALKANVGTNVDLNGTDC